MAECSAVYAEEATKLMLLGQPEDAATNLTHAMQVSRARAAPLSCSCTEPHACCLYLPYGCLLMTGMARV